VESRLLFSHISVPSQIQEFPPHRKYVIGGKLGPKDFRSPRGSHRFKLVQGMSRTFWML
jgi:hypothetical protein